MIDIFFINSFLSSLYLRGYLGGGVVLTLSLLIVIFLVWFSGRVYIIEFVLLELLLVCLRRHVHLHHLRVVAAHLHVVLHGIIGLLLRVIALRLVVLVVGVVESLVSEVLVPLVHMLKIIEYGLVLRCIFEDLDHLRTSLFPVYLSAIF